MLKNSYDVVVVGGGPSGSMAAWESARGGASVCLLEKDRDIGYPVRCGEAAAKSGIKQFVEIKQSWIAEEITGAILVAPNNKHVNIDFSTETGYILNRRIFDYDLSRYAAKLSSLSLRLQWGKIFCDRQGLQWLRGRSNDCRATKNTKRFC